MKILRSGFSSGMTTTALVKTMNFGAQNTRQRQAVWKRQDFMHQRCQEVEQKLRIYCMGLVEEESQYQTYAGRASDWSWYGHTYDSIWPAANRPPLEFIHRTAHDFLIDTETGREILDMDTSSGFSLNYQLT